LDYIFYERLRKKGGDEVGIGASSEKGSQAKRRKTRRENSSMKKGDWSGGL